MNQESEENNYSLKQVFMILVDVLKNKNLQVYFSFRLFIVGALMINQSLGQVYLTNDVSNQIVAHYNFLQLKFPAEKLSMI